jgi:hypothetical protein
MFNARFQASFLRSVPTARARLYHPTPLRLRPSDGHDPSVSQGHASVGTNKSPQDVLSESAKAGKGGWNQFYSPSSSLAHTAVEAGESTNPVDAASSNRQSQTHRGDVSGNKEGVGFAEQVGSASTAGSGSSHKGGEEASAPGVWGSIKQGLGLGTGSGDVKQNQVSAMAPAPCSRLCTNICVGWRTRRDRNWYGAEI